MSASFTSRLATHRRHRWPNLWVISTVAKNSFSFTTFCLLSTHFCVLHNLQSFFVSWIFNTFPNMSLLISIESERERERDEGKPSCCSKCGWPLSNSHICKLVFNCNERTGNSILGEISKIFQKVICKNLWKTDTCFCSKMLLYIIVQTISFGYRPNH